MEMLTSIRYIINIFLLALGIFGFTITILTAPTRILESGIITFLMVCALCMVYGINNSILREEI
jgi:hypothetical protein